MSGAPVVNVATPPGGDGRRIAGPSCRGLSSTGEIALDNSRAPASRSGNLHEDSDRLAHGLESIGIHRGTRTVLMVPPGLGFFSLTFALFKIGAVPVLIDPGMGMRNLGRCLAEAEPEAFIGIPKAHLARKLLGWGRSTIRITVTTGWGFGRWKLRRLRALTGKSAYPQAPTHGRRTGGDPLHQRQHRSCQRRRVHARNLRSPESEMLRSAYGIEAGRSGPFHFFRCSPSSGRPLA